MTTTTSSALITAAYDYRDALNAAMAAFDADQRPVGVALDDYTAARKAAADAYKAARAAALRA